MKVFQYDLSMALNSEQLQEIPIKDRYLTFGFVRRLHSSLSDMKGNRDLYKNLPELIMHIVLSYFYLFHEILKFSTEYKSSDGLQLSDDNRCVKATKSNHKHILADIEPVTKGIHCWRIQVNHSYIFIIFLSLDY